MRKKFKNKEVEKLANDEKVIKWKNIEKVARKKIEILLSVNSLEDLKKLVKNLHKLKHGREGQRAFNINDQFRLIFIWEEDQPWEIDIVDYHDEKK